MMGIGIMAIRNANGELEKLYFLLTTMTEACDKMHFTLFRTRSRTGFKI